MKKLTILIIPLIMIMWFGEGLTAGQMEFKMVWESPQLSKVPIELMTAVDLNGNGTKEVLFNDFSYSSDIHREAIGYSPFDLQYHFWIWEWGVNEMKQKWKREFPPTIKHEDKYYFLINRVQQLNTWEIGGHKIVEAYPPYFQVRWDKGAYQYKEQYNPHDKDAFVGSWTFPFQSAACHAGSTFASAPILPNECVLGVRIFGSSKKEIRIVTRIAEKEGKTFPSKLRVRKFEKSFPIEWEDMGPIKFEMADVLDPLNEKIPTGLLIKGGVAPWSLFIPLSGSKGYKLIPLKGDPDLWGSPPFLEVKAGMTQKKGLWEYWGYRRVVAKDGGWETRLRRVYLNKDQTELLIDDIFFPTHDRYLGIGYFTLADLDNDGIDEVIFVEKTGKRTIYHEDIEYTDTADYVLVFKWDGKAYRSVWVSPALKKRGSKVLVDDVMGNGKKQIVVGTGHGTIQIWERK